MPDDVVDLRGVRGRLARLGLAVVLGLGVTVAVMLWIVSVSAEPNKDPVGGSIVWLLAIAMFVVTTAGAHAAIAAVARRR
jgi:hypothetical protein